MLDQLSAELIEHISSLIEDVVDLFSLRLVSRYLHSTTYRTFATRCFRTIVLDFTPRSLLRIAKIARYETLRDSVRHIRAGSVLENTPIIFGEGHIWPREQSDLLDLTSPLVRGIQDLLLRFSRCNEMSATDESSHYLCRDGEDTWLSPMDVFSLMCSVLARPEAYRIEKFNVKIDCVPESSRPRQLSSATVNSTFFLASWSYIRRLDISWKVYPRLANITFDLVTRATSLRSLALRFGIMDSADLFLRQLANASTVPDITDLKIRCMSLVTSDTFANAVVRLQRSLTSIRISYVSFESGNWSTFFSRLAEGEFPRLESFTVYNVHRWFFCPLRMRQDVLAQCGGQFEFELHKHSGKSRVSGVRYHGPPSGVKLALRALGNDVSYPMGFRVPSPGHPDMQEFEDRVGVTVSQLF